jgi:GxxExxY protein
VIAAARAVYTMLGEGYAESVYEKAMAIEFRANDTPYTIENNVEVMYRGECVGMQRLDFVIAGQIAVELKAGGSITKGHVSQTRAYLRTTQFAEAIIINFPSPQKDEIVSHVVERSPEEPAS